MNATANSVSVIYPSTISFDVKVPYCEEVYKKANLPCVFKLTDEDKELNEYFETRGYKAVTPTDVMILELKDKAFQKGECVFSKEPTEEGLRAFFAFEGIYCSVIEDDKVVACASAAVEQGY